LIVDSILISVNVVGVKTCNIQHIYSIAVMHHMAGEG